MGGATPATEPGPAAAAPPTPRPRLRLTGIVGAVAALCLGGAFFLPWVRVDEARARQFQDAVERELAGRDPPSAAGEGFRELAATMVREHALRGADFVHWVRTAQAFSAEIDAQVNPGVDAAAHQRRLQLVRLLLYGMPAGALLLAAYFLFHRFRRVRWPVLVLCILVGVAGMVLAATLQFSLAFVGQALPAVDGGGGGGVAAGWLLLVAGGAGLALAGVFGVTVSSWFRVYAVSAATAAALGVVAARYLATGGLPWGGAP